MSGLSTVMYSKEFRLRRVSATVKGGGRPRYQSIPDYMKSTITVQYCSRSIPSHACVSGKIIYLNGA